VSVWATVDHLLDRAEDPAGLRAHGVQLLAARRWRATGRPVPAALLADERSAAIATLAVPVLLARVRAALNGPIVLLKGPEVAARYPDPALRPLGDLDLLVPDAPAAERALRAVGFEPAEGEQTAARQPHQPPLRWPTSPLRVELHHTLPVPAWSRPPPADQVLAAAVPAAIGDGILTLPPAAHALLLAGHAWVHYGPRPRLRDLVDVAVMTDGLDLAEMADLARTWDLPRVWQATAGAVAALDGSLDPSPTPWRRWVTPVPVIRERTVAQEHLVRWLGAFWAPSPRAVPRAVVLTVGRDLRPLPGEAWSTKLPRMGQTVRSALAPGSRPNRSG
jgi:hypothetical protein